MKQCAACGTRVPDEAKFCSNCGSNNFAPVAQPSAPLPAENKKSTKAKWIVPVAAGAAVMLTAGILTIVTLISLLNPVKQVMREIESKEYAKANEIYYEKIAADPERYQSTREELVAYVEDLTDRYRSEKITYEQVTEELRGIESTGILYDEIYSAYNQVDSLNYARSTYAQAVSAMEAGDPLEAMYLYAEVMYADFENAEAAAAGYNQAMETYRTQVQTDVQAQLDAGNYADAIYLADLALTNLPEDPDILALRATCVQAEYDAGVQAMWEEVDLYLSQNDFVGALTCLDGHIATLPDETKLLTKRQECVSDFEVYVTAESLRLAKAGEYRHALSLAESGLGYFESTRVTELSIIYKSHLPVLLGEMEIFANNTKGGSWASYTNFTDDYLEDNYSNTYSHSVGAGCGSLTYLTNFKYQTLSGTVAFPKGLRSDDARSSATLTIYGDGKEIAVFANISETSRPQTFNLGISSYEKITLKWSCEGYNIWGDWGDFATIFDGQFVPIPLELPEA
ncbi:MAG: NPCBM/NEW2 domain-containing protein [Clostridia bacterium]|nr:NPCBM/NEW2 domain-containing protein [Clostridia bacterium]